MASMEQLKNDSVLRWTFRLYINITCAASLPQSRVATSYMHVKYVSENLQRQCDTTLACKHCNVFDLTLWTAAYD